MYVVVEGIDFSGKSHLIDQLKEVFNKEVFVKEPFDGSCISKLIRREIQDSVIPVVSEAVLLLTSRLELFQKYNRIIEDKDRILFSDRCFITSMVYQHSPKLNFLRIMEMNKSVMQINEFDIIPDVLIYMDTDYDTAYQRFKNNEREVTHKDKMNMMKANYLKKQDNYRTSINMVKRMDTKDKMKIIFVKPDELFESVLERLTEILNDKRIPR